MEALAGICIICSKGQKIEDAQILKCGHLFHVKCIKEWLENRLCCPICRAKDDTSVQIFRPSFDIKKLSEKPKIENSNETMTPFFAYKNYEELKNETMEKIQSLWKSDEIAQMNTARVFLAAGKSHSMCKKAMKQKKLFDAYYFALRTGYLLKSMEKTADFMMYYRNHEYEFREVSEDNFYIVKTFETYLLPVFQDRKFSKDETDKFLKIYEISLASNGKEHRSNFFTSLP